MQRLIALILAAALTSDLAFAAPTVLPALLKDLPQPDGESVIKSGEILGLSFKDQDALYTPKAEETKKAESRKLSLEVARRFIRFLSKLPKDDPEQGLALALRSYLAPRMPAAQLEDNAFIRRDPKGRLVPTRLGLNALGDILLASDGESLEPLPAPKPATLTAERGPVSLDPAGAPAGPGGLKSVSRHAEAMKTPDQAFDGASRHELGAFDWSSLGQAPAVPGGLTSVTASKRLEGFSVDEKAGTVRVLVAARGAVKDDYLQVKDPAKVQGEICRQTGLDEKLFTRHGAKVVRAVDNIVAIDIPISEAASLGLALQEQGIESRPARVYKAASQAAQGLRGAAGSLLGGQFLPVPTEGYPEEVPPRRPGARPTDAKIPVPAPIANPWAAPSPNDKLADSSVQVNADSLRRAGMTGKGVLVGVIDSGIDMDHKDFKNPDGSSRVQDYMDFTGEGKDDVVGHGTHVGGIIGGSGASSDGKYKGSASDVRFKVAKVFGTKGETDESVILAAMKWMAKGDKPGDKADLVNMSLGGPGAANQDPLSSMANQLTVKNNILVVAAAGNSGPFDGSVGSPGNARYALTVGGVDKDGKPAFFSSRGPVLDEQGKPLYGKPDVMAVSGNVDFSQMEQNAFDGLMWTSPKPAGPQPDPKAGLQSVSGGFTAPAALGASYAPRTVGSGMVPTAAAGKCIYGPGVISARSSKDPDAACVLDGNPAYRYMSGTSQATPMAAGFAADVIGYAKANGAEVNAFQVKAALMETATDINQRKDTQGAGLIDGKRLSATVAERVRMGIPIGNVAFSLAMRLTGKDLDNVKNQSRYQLTPLGLLDTRTGHLVNTETGIDQAIEAIRRAKPPIVARRDPETEAAGA